MIKAVFIDMDDTLIVNQALYSAALVKLQSFLAPYGVAADEVSRAHADVEKILYPQLGYSRARYPLSFEKTLQHFMPDADADMIAAVRTLAEEVFTTIAPVKDGVPDALRILAAHCPVYLVTQGDKTVQENRIKHLPFRNIFTATFIVDQKSPDTYRHLTQKLGLDPATTVMIGDSIKSDVAPAVAAGLKGAWIEADNWRAIEQTAFPARNAVKCETLLSLAQRIRDNGDIFAANNNAPRNTPHQRHRK